MRVLVVDDHNGFRHALVTTLGLVNGMEVVGEAGDGDSAYNLCMDLSPDVVLMDMSMPGISGVDTMRMIHRKLPDLPVVILTAHADEVLEDEARIAGAAGFIAKGGGLAELVEQLLKVVAAAGIGDGTVANGP